MAYPVPYMPYASVRGQFERRVTRRSTLPQGTGRAKVEKLFDVSINRREVDSMCGFPFVFEAFFFRESYE